MHYTGSSQTLFVATPLQMFAGLARHQH